MARGRRPKPTALRLVSGNAGKRALPKREPKPRVGLPPCPTWLKPLARAEWLRIEPELVRLGVATTLDFATVAAYCQEFAHWQECEANAAREGLVMVLRNDKGEVKWAQPSPWVALAMNHLKLMRAYLVELGFTPASRSKVAGVPPEGEKDPFEEFLSGPKG